MDARRGAFLRRRLRADREGVSGVVAAALGVVLISILLSMVVTFWVPAWGYDSEVDHSRQVLEAFGTFKSSVEIRAVQGATNQTVTSSVPLGVGAVPMFGAETPGQLSYRYLEGDRPRFQARLTDSGSTVNLSAAGALHYEIANRYYDRQAYSYESGAVVLNQSAGATVRLPPAFSVSNTSGGVLVSVTLVTLEGDAKTLTGVEPRTITSRISVALSQEFDWSPSRNISFEVWTWYPTAWARFFNDTAQTAGLANGSYQATTDGTGAPWHSKLVISGVTHLAVTSTLVRVQLD